jgi:hypothetical protein
VDKVDSGAESEHSDADEDREKVSEENFRKNQAEQRDDPKKALRGKQYYYLGVVNMIVTIWLTSSIQWMMPIFYTTKFPFLIFGRLYQYTKSKWHLFLMDFCYFANAALIVYLWAFPHEPIYFQAIFALTHGPLSIAIITFKNSLVFHAVDKITSLFIHFTPPVVTYCIRWFHKPGQWLVPDVPQGPAGNAFMSRFTPCVDKDCTPSMIYLVCVAAGFFLAHQLFYFFVVQVIFGKRIRRDTQYLTTYRYLTKDRKGYLWNIVNVKIFGKPRHVFMFGFVNFCFCVITLLPTIVWYSYWVADFLYLIFLGSVAIWNGAGFYSSVLIPPKVSKPANPPAKK